MHQDTDAQILLAASETLTLKDTNLWIADTATTVHTTPHPENLTKTQEMQLTTIMGNGSCEKSTLVSKIVVNSTDKCDVDAKSEVLSFQCYTGIKIGWKWDVNPFLVLEKRIGLTLCFM